MSSQQDEYQLTVAIAAGLAFAAGIGVGLQLYAVTMPPNLVGMTDASSPRVVGVVQANQASGIAR